MGEPLVKESIAEELKFLYLQPSVLTGYGKLENVKYHEEDVVSSNVDIKTLDDSDRIFKIESNYGYRTRDDYKEVVSDKPKSNRGRKKKIKPRSTRKIQGKGPNAGKHFSSMALFHVKSIDIPGKIYKAKVFRNGVVEVTGGLCEDMSDIEDIIMVLIGFFKKFLKKDDVKLVDMYSLMRNYKTSTENKDYRIRLDQISKQANFDKTAIEILSSNKLDSVSEEMKEKILKRKTIIEKVFTGLDLSVVTYNAEIYPGVIIKFNTPIERNIRKQTTIKIFASGKINIDGTISPESAKLFYERIILYITSNKDFYYKIRMDSDSDD